MMADFDPPDSHWAANFDGRLLSSFQYLKDELVKANARIAHLEHRIAEQDQIIADGIADAKTYARGN